MCLPITSKVKGYPFEVALPKSLEVEGVILSEQIKTLDFVAREIVFICEAPHEVLVNVQKNVVALVGEVDCLI
ncbi:MAG: hypothetical protein COB07_11485 [Sulfurovum sp.]|nr:MAG: hypothetical protein COB07_11485 [Sulfurovum sp.]